MIELIAVSSGTVSLKALIRRKTKLRQIDYDVIINLSVYSSNNENECVSYECSDFPNLIEANYNRDVSYFTKFNSYVFQDSGITSEINTSRVDNEILQKFKIIFDREFFFKINLSQYESTLRKVIRTIAGV